MSSDTLRPRGRPRKQPALTPPALPVEYKEFDSLPGSGFVRLPVVRLLFGGISSSSVWRCVKAGTIPGPVKLTDNVSAWSVNDLRAALARRPRHETH